MFRYDTFLGNLIQPTVTDPYWANVVLLVDSNRDDGLTGAQVPVDRKGLHAFGLTAGATLSTVQKKFGAASMRFDGTNNRLFYTPDSADWLFGAYTGVSGTGDFTIEMWVYSNVVGTKYFFSQWNSTGNQRSFVFSVDSTGLLGFTWTSTGTNPGAPALSSGAGAFPMNQWCFLTISRNNGTMRMFIDGVMKAKGTVSTSNFNSTYELQLGTYIGGGAADSFNGYMQEVRVTKGVGRYGSDATFLVPTAPFPRS